MKRKTFEGGNMRGSHYNYWLVRFLVLFVMMMGETGFAQNNLSNEVYHPAIQDDFMTCGGCITLPPEYMEKYKKEEEARQRRLAEVDSTSDVETLKKIVLAEEHWEVRMRAVEKIGDQSFLTNVARIHPDCNIRAKAVEGLTDTESWMSYASDSNAALRRAVVRKSTDQQFLAQMAMKDPDYGVRQDASEKLNDTNVLEIMGFWIDPERTAKLKDGALLEKLALEARNEEVRAVACKSVTNQAALKKILSEDNLYSGIRRAAVGRLTDQPLLVSIARSDRDSRVRKLAASRITDPGLLSEFGVWLKPEMTRQVTNQVLLTRIIMESHEKEVRYEAIRKLENEPLLKTISEKDFDPQARREAIQKLNASGSAISTNGQGKLSKAQRDVSKPMLHIDTP